MKLIKFAIKNMRKLNIEINGEPNVNKIDFDIKDNYFIDVDGKKISKTFALIGGNGTGKTSTLELFSFLKSYFGDVLKILMIQKIYVSFYKENNAEFITLKKARISNKDDKFNDFILIGELINENHSSVAKMVQDIKNDVIKEFYKKNAYNTEEPIHFSFEALQNNKIQKCTIDITNFGLHYDEKNEEIILKFFKTILPFEITTGIENNAVYNNWFNDYNDDSLGTKLFEISKKIGKKAVINFLKMFDANIEQLIYRENMKSVSSYHINGKNEPVELKSFSKGMKKSINLFAELISQQGNKILLIDEIENHLSVGMITFFFKLIQSRSDIQLIYTTHNSTTLELISKKQIFCLTSEMDDETDLNLVTAFKYSSRFNTNYSPKAQHEKGLLTNEPTKDDIINFILKLDEVKW